MTARCYCPDDNVVLTSNLADGQWIGASSEAAPKDFDWSKRRMPLSSRSVSSLYRCVPMLAMAVPIWPQVVK
jgi:hypothetical protein